MTGARDPGWRDDPGWRLVGYDEAFWETRGGAPQRPTDEAELAQPDCWASQYVGGIAPLIVATWWRPGTRP